MYHSLIQILSAARLLARPQGVGFAELQDRLGISRRSVYRLLDALDELGYPYYDANEGRRERRYRLIEGEDTLRWWLPAPAISFDLEDRILLDFLFQDTRTPGLTAPLRHLRETLGYIAAPVGYSIVSRQNGTAVSVGRNPILLRAAPVGKSLNKSTDAVLRTLLKATTEHRVCTVSYGAISTGAVKTYKVHPLAIFENGGGMYVFVVVPYHGTIRTLAIERIRALELADGTFDPPDNFDPKRLLSDPFGIVVDESFRARIRFAKDQASYIRERSWPTSALLEEKKGGAVVLSVNTASAYGLKRWVLSFGSSAKVLEPIWLREEIATELEAAAKQYFNG